MITEAVQKLSTYENLSCAMARSVMEEMMTGRCTASQIASYLVALAMKKPSVDEIVGSAQGMRAQAIAVRDASDALEIVGTGGDHAGTFNISTTSAFVIASAGVKVAKHGNRAVTSQSGAADCLEALGANLDVDASRCRQLLETTNFCFLFAPNHHRAMRYAAPVRKELGMPTIFNLLGPLTNPAGTSRQVLGVYEPGLVEPMAQALVKLGVQRGLVVCGMDGLDEISASAPTLVCEIDGKTRKTYEITPADFGYPVCQKEELAGQNAMENAKTTRAILAGEERGPRRDIVCMNAGAALYVAQKAASIAEGVRLAERLIDSGAALRTLDTFVEESHG
ncbi:anthranilate phosphoribosyltransferase [uncultured Dubosiella sp.]|uniref:anthranilate phosphoribosyltransferase n=1 Tax=uncultured Dubosiella sp. TaxID=1937011 RepID=UPI0027301ECA|nr:anthranilate phosphoribosyltransferase [uncultured Dubosiella sp.]